MITVITPLKLRSIPALNRLFTEAVRQHFTYFTEEAQHRLIKDHSRLRLLMAYIDPRRTILTAHCDGLLVGYAIGSVPRGGAGELFWLYVDPAQRGANIGLSLLSRMIRLQEQKGAKTVTLSTHDHRRYYERQGFVFVRPETVDGVSMDVMQFKLGSHA